MRLLWLPDVLRAAGLTVHEYGGWSTRGSADWGPIRGITCHATAGSRTSTDAGELRVLVNGSATAPPPIAQLYLSRSGQWWVVAAGKCNHNKTGWDGPNQGYGNSRLIGIEAQHSNTTAEPWPDVQYRSYVRGVAALVKHLGIPVYRVAGHKEHQPYATRPPGEGSTKSDPTFNMDQFRRDVTAALAGEDDDVSAKDVIDGLRATQAYQSAGVGRAAARAGQGPVSQRVLAEYTWSGVNALAVQVAGLTSVVDLLGDVIRSGGGNVDTAAILAGVDQRVSAAVQAIEADTRDAVADLGEGGAEQVRAEPS